MKFKFLKIALVGFVLSVSGLANVANAGLIIGNLNYENGDTFVSDSLNNVNWMRFDANGARGSLASVSAMFSDINSEFYGYTIAGTTYADKFLAAAFGITIQPNALGNSGTLANGLDGVAFTQVMGDGYTANSNNVWKFAANDDLTGNGVDNYVSQGSSFTNLRRDNEFSIDSWAGSMSFLAYKETEISEVPEPTSLAIFALGLMGLGYRRFKKN